MDVWRIMANHGNPEAVASWLRDHSRVVMGWGNVGDVVKEGYSSAEEITDVARIRYPENTNVRFSGPPVWNFCYSLKQEDLVIVSAGKRRVMVMQITGDYEYVSSKEAPLSGDYLHQRKARVTTIDPNELWSLAGKTADGQNTYWALVKCHDPVELDTLQRRRYLVSNYATSLSKQG